VAGRGLARPQTQRAVVVAALTFANVVIIAMAAYMSVEYADSTAFYTGACHTPMQPEPVAR